MPRSLYHFSEDPAIRRFVPHVPASNPTRRPAVWAIDAEHAPLYWFPRDCPRIAVWQLDRAEEQVFRDAFQTRARRVHAMELGRLRAMRTMQLYRYTFDGHDFVEWEDAAGQWISNRAVEPVDVVAMGDLLDEHVAEGIELRAVPSLWPLHDLAVSAHWNFSIVRMSNALPRS